MSPSPADVTHLIVGPAEHGVVRCARNLAIAAGGPVVRSERPDELIDVPTGPVHLHFTDRLFGATAEDSATTFSQLANRLAAMTVTLHDVPPADGSGLQQRRGTTYAAVCTAARAVVVNSHHEEARLASLSALHPTVIPLPVDPLLAEPVEGPPGAPGANVVILGFVYPGKGHDEALAALPEGAGLLALGKASDGHQDLIEQLTRQAADLGRRFAVTGFVPDDEMSARLRQAAIPLAPHRQVSASGSIATWLAAGRRPLVPDTPYAHELETAYPGTLLIYDDLADALAAAWADPTTTWLARGTPVGPASAEVASMYRAFWRTAFG